VNTIIRNAKTRASILSSLDNSFGGKGSSLSSSKTKTNPQRESIGGSKENSRDKMISNLMELVGDSSDRTRGKVSEQLVGKSLVLESVKQSETVASKLNKLARGKHRASNRQMRCVSAIYSDKAAAGITEDVLQDLQQGWVDYASMVINACKTPAQLQSRLLCMDMVGAKVALLQPSKLVPYPIEHTTLQWGTILAESMNCFHIAYITVQPPKSSKHRRRRRKRKLESIQNSGDVEHGDQVITSNNVIQSSETPTLSPDPPKKYVVLRKAVKHTSIFAVSLPSVLGQAGNKDGLCIIHGKQHLPHIKQNFCLGNIINS